ncbi:MAG TPA: hypothetical protein VFO57_12780 [Burkholderiales bacterium]|nr:hypothetical protein [Burkholderiales bacterium]
MNTLTSKLVFALALIAALSGCASTGPTESAVHWMDSQSVPVGD